MAVAACSGGADDDAAGGAGVEPATVVGESDQGLHVRIDATGPREVRLRFPADCRPGDSEDSGDDSGLLQPIALERHPFTTEVDDDGGFAVDEEYVEEGTDGDEDHVEVRIEGRFAADGTARGTLEATNRWYNGELGDFAGTCTTGPVTWTADRPPTASDHQVVALPEPLSMGAAGADLVVRTGAGELLRIDARGEARRLDGEAPTAPTQPETDPNAPSTVMVAPAVGAPGPGRLPPRRMTVVAGGVWTPDPATGTLRRYALDGGRPTASIDQPVTEMVATADALWTVSTNSFRNAWSLDRRDPTTGAVEASAPVRQGGVTAGTRSVWYADGSLAGGRLSRVDPATLALGGSFDVDLPQHSDELFTTGGRVWWIGRDGLLSLDLADGRVAAADLPGAPDAVAADATGLWATSAREAVARRIEGDRVVRTVDLPEGWWEVALTTDGAVWLAGTGPEGVEPQVIRLDPTATGG
jgi:hypothetical protein